MPLIKALNTTQSKITALLGYCKKTHVVNLPKNMNVSGEIYAWHGSYLPITVGYSFYVVLQIKYTVVSTELCRVAPWCSQRTASFRPPLSTLTSIQNLGGLWFSSPSIDSHSNYDNFQRMCSNLSELLQQDGR